MAVEPAGANARARPAEITNGHAKSAGSQLASSRAQRKTAAPERAGFLSWLTSIVMRIFVWYGLVTLIFRCPADESLLTDTSPKLCKPYFQARSLVKPYAQPYYDAHVHPHVEKLQPYYDRAQAQYIGPATTFASKNYAKYGAPQVTRAQKYGQAQWDSVVVPQSKIAAQQALQQYHSLLGPYVQKIDVAARPYYKGIISSASDFWQLELRPAYKFTSPYAQKAYRTTDRFVRTVAVPYTLWANSIMWTSVNRHVLPTVRVLYGENVEPQVVRIKQRLGRYRDEKKVEAAVSSVEEEKTALTTDSVTPSASSTVAAEHVPEATAPTTTSSLASASTLSSSVTPQYTAVKSPSELFTEDLTLWEKQTTTAIHEGVEHLRERIGEIATNAYEKQVKLVGESLLIQLEELHRSSVQTLQSKIKAAVHGLPEAASKADVEVAHRSCEDNIRSVGKDVRNKAQHIRDWRRGVETETASLVESAANSTLETIDNIRELRLQEIGRRWASDEEITHKDWARYNELKRTSGQLRKSVIGLIEGDASLAHLRSLGADIEERAMATAQDAAQELNRLKGVALWKLRAKDDSDNFGSKVVAPVIAKAQSKVADAARDATQAVLGTSQGSVESVTSSVASYVSHASDSLLSTTASVESSASSVSSSVIQPSLSQASSAASKMSKKVGESFDGKLSMISISLPDATQASSASSVISKTASSLSSVVASHLADASSAAGSVGGAAASSASSAASVGSSSLASAVGASTPTLSQVSSSAVEAASGASSVASSLASSASSIASAAGETVSKAATTATKRVFAGAMAQAVPSQQPVFDEPLDADDESSFDSAMGAGWEQVASMTQALHDAIHGTGASSQSTKVAEDLYQSAFTAISNVFYGTESSDPFNKKFASEKYSDAVAAASVIIYGTPTPTYQSMTAVVTSGYNSLAAQASSRYNEALAYASAQSVAAKSMVAAKISGTPKPIQEQMIASIESAYSDSLAIASAKLAGALQYTSLVVPTQAPLASVSSVAALRLAEGLSRASAQYSSLKSSAGLGPTPAHQSVLNEAQRQYYEGIGYAHEQYSSYVSSASRAIRSARAQITPAPTPTYQALLASAQSQYAVASAAAASALENALNAASSAAGVTSTTPAQSVLDAASEQYSLALLAASSVLYGTQTPAYEAYLSAASSRYNDFVVDAAYKYESLSSAALSAAGAQATGTSVLQDAVDAASSQYDAALAAAAAAFGRVSKDASEAVYGSSSDQVASASSALSAYIFGTEPAWTDSVASQASENWEAIVSAASEKVYGQPSPVYASVTDQVAAAAAQATSAANDQYSAVSSLFASLVAGQEPEFTNRVLGQLSSAYYTGAAAVASSASSAAASVYSDASSAISAVFTPPATVEDILSSITAQLDAAVEAASQGVYGTETGTIEKATSAAASVASDAAATASSYASDISASLSTAVYGTPAPYLSQAQSAADNAYAQISSALFNAKPTPTWPDFLSSSSGTTLPVADRISALKDAVVANAKAAGVSAAEYMHEFSLAARPEEGRASTLKEKYDMTLEQTQSFQRAVLEGAREAGYPLAQYVQSLRQEVKAQEAADQSRFQESYDSVKSAANVGYDTAASAVTDAASSVSSLVFGAEKTGALESVSKRIAEAMESARSKIDEYQSSASSAATEATALITDSAAAASAKIESIARSVKDEL